eukprot:Rmarinus@m.4089
MGPFGSKYAPSAPVEEEEPEELVKSFQYVILGGGIAAGYAADQFVKSGLKPGSLCLISNEKVPPYERPALTKGYLVSSIRLPTFYTCAGAGGERHAEEWYEENKISLFLNTTVVSSDVENKTLETSTGLKITYEILLIATGCRPRKLEIPNSHLKGIYYFYDRTDAENVDALVKPNDDVLLIGGGFLSMEVGAALRDRGMCVHIVYQSEAPMGSLWPPEIGQHYAKFYEDRGVHLYDQVVPVAFESDTKGFVKGLRIDDDGSQDTLSCQLAIIAVGSEPETSLFQGQLDISAKGYITVGPRFRTSCDYVYAVGSCCSFPSRLTGEMRTDHGVYHARESAVVCVKGLMDLTSSPYNYIRHRYSRIFFSRRWKLFGDCRGDVVISGDFDPKLLAFWVDHNRLVGGFLESGTDNEYILLRTLVNERPKVSVKSLRGRTLEEVYYGCIGVEGTLDETPEHYSYIILGGGVSAGYAAREFVARNVAPNDLCIITKEPFAPYERPALSKGYLITGVRLPNFHTCVGVGGARQTRQWYSDHGIVLKTETNVVYLDFQNKTLLTSTGRRYSWQQLIIATGVVPKRLPMSSMKGVYYLRELMDAQAIVDHTEHAIRCVVLGSGYIGMEVAAALCERELSVTMVLNTSYVMPMLFTPVMAKYYMDFYENRGVKFVLDAINSEFVAGEDGAICEVHVHTKDDILVLPCDMCVVGVGAEPDLTLVEEHLHCSSFGIQVDGYMRTSKSDVFAIGDCASFPLILEDEAIVRMEHVTHARSSAIQCVKTIHNEMSSPYDYLPFFYSRLFSTLSWKFYGLPRGTPVVCGAFDPKLWVYFVRDGLIVGVFLESGTEDEFLAIERIARRRPRVDVEELKGVEISELARRLEADEARSP